MNEAERRREARAIAENRYGFRWNLAMYPIVNAGLVALWYFTGPFTGDAIFFWPIFPIIFWGLGVVAHYISAYRLRPGGDWITKETERVLQEKEGRNP